MAPKKDNGDNAKKQKVYLEALAVTGAGRVAAKHAHVSYQTVQKWRSNDPAFAEAETEAKEALADELEAITATVALDPGHPQSTTNRIFLLKSLRPEKYKDKPLEKAVENVLTGLIKVPPKNGNAGSPDSLGAQPRAAK